MSSNSGKLTASVSMQFKYTASEVNATKKELSKEIVESIHGDSQLRNEMRRTFQQANRRIQNIERAGLSSPAVMALGKADVTGYSKFSVRGFGNSGSDWEYLKSEYAKAITFLQQPTSTASGARTWENQVKNQLGITDDVFKYAINSVINEYNDVLGNTGLVKYTAMLQDVYDVAIDNSANEIERGAYSYANQMEKDIKKIGDEVAGQAVDEIIEEFTKAFTIK